MQHIRTSGGVVFNLHGSVYGKHMPDLIGGYNGKPFAVEVKDATGTPSKGQTYRLRQLQTQGYVTGVVRSVDDFKELFK